MKKPFSQKALSALVLSFSLLMQSCGIVILDPNGEETTGDDTPLSTTAPLIPGETDSISYENADRTEEYQAIADVYLERISAGGYDYDGASFFVATPTENLISGEESGDHFARAVYKRNARLEDALNVRLASSMTDANAYFDLLNASVLADDYFADLLQIPIGQLGVFAAGDVLINLRSVPLLDLNQPYFFSDSIEAATAGNQILAAAGAGSLDCTTLSAVYFNRDLFLESQLPLPYEAVYQGTWTWDALMETFSALSDLNSGAQDKIYSFAAQYSSETLPAMIFAAGGGKLVKSTVGTSPRVAISDYDTSMLDTITRLYADDNRYRDAESSVSQFYNGGALYLIDRLFLMSWMPDSRQNWGVLPLPKMTEEQTDYITLSDSSALCFAIQRNTVDVAAASIMMSAINAASYGVLREAYVNYAMNELLRDNDSANMLSIIASHPTYDFALAFESTTLYLSEATTAGLRALTSGTTTKALYNRASAADRQLSRRFPAS